MAIQVASSEFKHWVDVAELRLSCNRPTEVLDCQLYWELIVALLHPSL